MKCILLIEGEEQAQGIANHLNSLGFESVRYRNPLKALDNIDEIDPNAVIVCASDYPRHWKVIVDVLRVDRSKEECVVVLLGGPHFDYEEAAKAAHLGVNGVIGDDLSDPRERLRLERLLRRYVEIRDSRVSERLAPSTWDRINFMFSHPKDLLPVRGHVESLSADGISLSPLPREFSDGLVPGIKLEACSLRAGDRIIDIDCRILRAERGFGMSIEAIAPSDRSWLTDYLAGGSEREMRSRLKKTNEKPILA